MTPETRPPEAGRRADRGRASTEPGPDDPGDHGDVLAVAAEWAAASTEPGPDDPGDHGDVLAVAAELGRRFNGAGAG